MLTSSLHTQPTSVLEKLGSFGPYLSRNRQKCRANARHLERTVVECGKPTPAISLPLVRAPPVVAFFWFPLNGCQEGVPDRPMSKAGILLLHFQLLVFLEQEE